MTVIEMAAAIYLALGGIILTVVVLIFIVNVIMAYRNYRFRKWARRND